MQGISKLFSKSISIPTTAGSIVGKFKAPNGTVSYDFCSGVGKKGNFETYLFKNTEGKPVGRCSVFDKAGEVTTQQRSYEYDKKKSILNIVDVKTSNTGNIIENSTNQMIFKNNPNNPRNKNDFFVFQIKEMSTNKDSFEVNLLHKGKPKQGVSFDTNWDGKKPKIKYTNIDEKFKAPNQQYLPLAFSRLVKTTDKRIAHISALEEMRYGIEGLCPPVKRVPIKEVNNGSKVAGDCMALADCSTDGRIRIADTIQDSPTLLRTLGHEYKHARDFSKIYRIKDSKETPEIIEKSMVCMENAGASNIRRFYTEAIKKGEIPENSKTGKYYKKLMSDFKNLLNDEHYMDSIANHDAYWSEKRANAEGQKEVNKLMQVTKDLFKFLWEPRQS